MPYHYKPSNSTHAHCLHTQTQTKQYVPGVYSLLVPVLLQIAGPYAAQIAEQKQLGLLPELQPPIAPQQETLKKNPEYEETAS